ncbi:MAG: hypothetical protein WC004_00540 [Candidatus Absconditabacterales bacterium]
MNNGFFSVVDVVEVLADTKRGRKYRSDLKGKLAQEGSEVSEKIGQLKLLASDGKMRETDVTDVETFVSISKQNFSTNYGHCFVIY